MNANCSFASKKKKSIWQANEISVCGKDWHQKGVLKNNALARENCFALELYLKAAILWYQRTEKLNSRIGLIASVVVVVHKLINFAAKLK